MSNDLYKRAAAAFWSEPRPDWKHDMAHAYTMMEQASTPGERSVWKNRLAEAYLPLAFYLAYKHSSSETRRRVSYTQQTAFDCAIAALPRALADFDSSRTDMGAAGISSYVAKQAEWEILHGLYTHVRHGKLQVAIDIDAYEDTDSLGFLSYDDEIRIDSERPVMDIIRDVIATLGPADAFLASSKLLDGMTWQEIADAGRAHGGRGYNRKPDTWAYRWRVLRKRFADALRHAGYDEKD